jgi:hypothetical protein
MLMNFQLKVINVLIAVSHTFESFDFVIEPL